MAQRRNPEAQAQSFAARFPDNTPVWYYPIKGEDTRRATWIRGEPWILGHGEVVVKVKDVTGCVSIDHIEFREVRVEANATPEVAPAGPSERLAIYAYSASVSCPQHTARWDGTIERPRIKSHADFIEARQEIARDGMVADHMTIQIQHLSLVGYTRHTKRSEPAGQRATLKYTGEGNLYGWGFYDDAGNELDVRDGAIVTLPAAAPKAGE
ncbi:hypothetical protein PEp14_00039 [Erwinia phage PEp14]|uniref:Uncharacterized protein n=1 Tax=Erwinia phage PEp14 TaxID=1131315 RepID=H2DE69_9CAUD|nr:hypothetical protein PEp14_00039 [Erwinia phage PEp14]AEY69628.1 hypothetical protein PEp14_00039 [Erwinia phage PEp14]